jgi:putative NIF3 family GTP cyclohydrolase 1 type 2
MQGDVALYSAHLPLDRHPEVGNNWVLARRLEVTGIRPLEGMDPLIGVRGSVDVSRDALAARLGDIVGTSPRVIAAGPPRVRQVAVVTGAGASWLPHARAAGADTFITGEAPHHAFFDAEEWGMNLLLGGHYATETLGVKALAAHLGAKFNVGWEFVDHPTGL